MTIKTKYNIGDNVYYMADNKVEKGEVTMIVARINNCEEMLHYHIGTSIIKKEDEVFKTKKELLESL